MKTSGNTILITGGGTGIGLALAEDFVKADNEVILCGRREQVLQAAQNQIHQAHIYPCDLSQRGERLALHAWVLENFPRLNVLVNNAGIQNMIDLKQGVSQLDSQEDEIAINLLAPVHLSAMFIPHLAKKSEAAIINITSGLGFIPLAIMPVYCATKAGLHSFSLSLRQQLRDTSIRVFEIIPPTVDTGLDRGTRLQRGMTDRGIQPAVVAQDTLQALAHDVFEAPIGQAQNLVKGARQDPDGFFQRMNPR